MLGATLTKNNTTMYWYDLWNGSSGNIAYIQTDIEPYKMKELEKRFVNEYPRKRFESDVSYASRFLKYVKEKENANINVVNRPQQEISLDLA